MKRAADFLWRGSLGVLIAYLLWLPLEESLLGLVARGAQAGLTWFWSPPFVTRLNVVGGEFVDIRGLLDRPDQWLGRWDASNLPMFGFAAVGFSLVLPVRDIRQRVGLVGAACLGAFFTMMGAAILQIPTVATNTVFARHGVILLNESERKFLEVANETLNLVELLVPALLIALVYTLLWWRPAEGGRSAPTNWRGPVLLWALLVTLVGLSASVTAVPDRAQELARFERTAALNPDSPRAWLALGEAAQRVAGQRGAAEAYRHVLRLGGLGGPARVALARILLRERKLPEALRVAQGGPVSAENDPELVMVEVRVLLALAEPCAAFRRADRVATHEALPQLRRVRKRAGVLCRQRTKELIGDGSLPVVGANPL